MPGFEGFLERADLVRLACRDDVESRLIVRDGRNWTVRSGPFRRREFAVLPARNWTLLVQGVNLHCEAGARLLARFDFLPHARLDDLMVSYAAPGGGVGPHFDSYDVFLLQGSGRRRWQVSRQRDLDLVQGAPLKILRRFRPEQAWTLEAGDMLYLPPRYAHKGVALDECTTYSIGFRAPALKELAARFLEDFADRIEFAGLYADPDLKPTGNPGRIGRGLVRVTEDTLARLRFKRSDVEDFLGRYFTEPKAMVYFDPPEIPIARRAFETAVARRGAVLDRKSLMLYGASAVYINGECTRYPRGVPATLGRLADRRHLPPARLSPPVAGVLCDWHTSGYLHLPDTDLEGNET
ncbi:MAG: cupin domain-containing protein [Betaproteobacteria bacterium]